MTNTDQTSNMVNSNKKPIVSAIIPTYNRGWIIKEAVDSILAQTFCAFELVVVDDGSTDNTLEILSGYKKDRIRIIQQDNKGVGAARNRGATASTGQYIAFLDSDDIWMRDKLSVQVKFFADHPDAMICQAEEIWIRRGIRVNPKKRHKKPTGMIFEPSLDLCLVSPSAVMMKKSLFDEMGGFDESFRVCEDYDLWLRIGCKYPIFLVDRPLIVKRGGHMDQLSRGDRLDKFRIRSIINIMESGRLSPSQYCAAQLALHKKCMIYGAGCQKRGRVDEAEYYENLAKKYASPGKIK